MPFNVNNCHILQVGTRNKKFEYEMNGTKLDSVQCVEDLGVSVVSSLKFSQQCKDAAGKANRILGFINRNIWFKTKDVVLPLYTSFVRPHLGYAVQWVGVAEWLPRGSGELGIPSSNPSRGRCRFSGYRRVSRFQDGCCFRKGKQTLENG